MKISNAELTNLLKPTTLTMMMALALTACGGSNGSSDDASSPSQPVIDTDKDGIADKKDNCPSKANTNQKDTDGDKKGDVCDSDIDGDGVENTKDAFPLNESESIDTDGDGKGNNADADDDGDGVKDSADAFPLNKSESVDTDGDGKGNNADTDDDGDGVKDSADAFPLNKSESVDTDGDGKGNNADTDDDGDGISDADEVKAGTDPLDKTSVPVNIPTPLAKFALDKGSIAASSGSKKANVKATSGRAYAQVTDRFGKTKHAARISEKDQVIKVNNFLFDTVSASKTAQASKLANSSFTYSAWLKAADENKYRGILSFNGRDFYLRLNNVVHCDCLELRGAGFSNTYNEGRKAIAKGKWMQIVVTYDAGTLRFYKDGKKFGESTGNTLKTGFKTMGLGGFSTDGGEPFRGDMDDVTFYAEALNEAQIKKLHNDEKVAHKTVQATSAPQIKAAKIEKTLAAE